jgi:hypothetical protein
MMGRGRLVLGLVVHSRTLLYGATAATLLLFNYTTFVAKNQYMKNSDLEPFY